MNCPVTIEGVMRSETINGSSVQALKGKTIRTKPILVVSDYVAVPHAIFEENRNVTLRRVPYQDGLFALILWYVSKNSLLIVGIGPILNKEHELVFRSDRSGFKCVYS